MQFKKFRTELQENFKSIIKNADVLFITDIEKDVIWETYLNSFPEAERQEHNCSACRHFLKPYANVVAIKDNKLVSMWDFACDEPYKTVANTLHELVISKPIRDVFVTKFTNLGIDFNHQDKEGHIITWNHFHLILPAKFVYSNNSDSVEAIMGEMRDTRNVFKRSLDELTMDAIETTLELIEQNSLYRGAEFKGIIEVFQKHKREYDKTPESEKENWCWANFTKAGAALSRIRNSAIGSLLIDISEGKKELDAAVTSFEVKMEVENRKRKTSKTKKLYGFTCKS